MCYIQLKQKVGIFTPKLKDVELLTSGEIGFITAGIKKVSDCKIGDTITNENKNDFHAIELTVFGEDNDFATLYFSEGMVNSYPALSITEFLGTTF